MSSSGEEEDGAGSISVDWADSKSDSGVDCSVKSFPNRYSRNHQRVETTPRNAISLYDSDSSDEFRKPRRLPSSKRTENNSNMDVIPTATTTLYRGLMRSPDTALHIKDDRSFDGGMSEDDGADEDDAVMILSDDEEEEVELIKERLGQLDFSSRSADPMVVPSMSDSLREKNELEAMFVEDKPWRTDRSKLNNIKRNRVIQHAISSSEDDEDPPAPPPRKQLLEKIEDDRESTDSEEDDSDDIHSIGTNSTEASGLSAVELDVDVVDDLVNFPELPNSFIGDGRLHPSMSVYLDDPLVTKNITKREANRFVMGHVLLVRAMLQLLSERDRAAGAASGAGLTYDDDPSNVLKKGSLKKFGHTSVGRPTWRVKYVEVRKGGVLSYYEDEHGKVLAGRKNISLRSCECKEVHAKGAGAAGYVFEVSGPKQPRRLWMANSDEERKSWMRAVQDSMRQSPKAGDEIDLAPYQLSVERFQHLKSNLWISQRKKDYLAYFQPFFSIDLVIPTKWQQICDGKEQAIASAADFYKFLFKTTVHMNGYSVPAESPFSPERVIGSVSRCILEFDRSSEEEFAHQEYISELQSIVYARELLLTVWKARRKDESHEIVGRLCENKSLVICLPYEEDPIQLNVSYTTVEDLLDSTVASERESQAAEISGWVTTRSKTTKNWKNRFVVVSEGVLSYYEHATPRPHGLRGQLVLVGAKLAVVDERQAGDNHLFVLQIGWPTDGTGGGQTRERQLSFRDENVFVAWQGALQKAIDVCSATAKNPHMLPKAGRRNKILNPASRIVKLGNGRLKGATEGGIKAIKGGADRVMRGFKKGKTGLGQPGSMNQKFHKEAVKQDPTVLVVVDASSYYRILTADPCGSEESDTWVTVRAKTSQSYHLSGGVNGSITRLEDVVTLSFRDGLVPPTSFGDLSYDSYCC